uniref:Protein lethal(2)essential for life n=1 Tax=Steinernema glaseri TaxID=37863 RepID=A0A1I8AVA1_9BILA
MDSDFVLTVQVQLADHVNLLKMKRETVEFDSVHAIRKDLDVQFQFGDLSMRRYPPEKPRPLGYTNVTIKGSLQNVESARTRLQNVMPITITLPLEAAKLKKDYSENELHDNLSLIRKESEHAYPTVTVK